ncbi:MAG: type-4 uracil-DNA glycosylase [Candidatus Aenigmatarchaeota archaeon]
MKRRKNIEELEERVKGCSKCDLSENRTNAVLGEGPGDADLMFIGEAPGREEDKEGRPFVGRAGKLLDELLENIGLAREEVYITNIILCRPPNNRDPEEEEIEACTPYLDEHISIVDPEIIVPLGSFATSYILDKYDLGDGTISGIHGKVFSVSNLKGQFKIIPQYHPAAALYNPELEDVLEEDFKKIEENL